MNNQIVESVIGMTGFKESFYIALIANSCLMLSHLGAVIYAFRSSMAWL